MPKPKTRQVVKEDAAWRMQLTRQQYDVCRRKGTERPFTGEYYDCKEPGVYRCVCCGTEVFSSAHKYDSGTGWPSFWDTSNPDAIERAMDADQFILRTEVLCSVCGAHLGHVFDDGPQPTNLRYCINSVSLKLDKKEDDE